MPPKKTNPDGLGGTGRGGNSVRDYFSDRSQAELYRIPAQTAIDTDWLEIADHVKPNESQPRRMLLRLLSKGESRTGELNPIAGVNLSAKANDLNPKLEVHGFAVLWRTDPDAPTNPWGETSSQRLWALYRLPAKMDIAS